MFQRMLVPLDGSELAESVLPYAAALAARVGLELTLFHVSPSQEEEFAPIHEAYMERAVAMARRLSEEAQQTGGIPAEHERVAVRSEMASGQPAEEILRYAEASGTDVVLMATRGRSGITRWAMGSVALKVLAASKVPVWLVRAGIPEQTVHEKWPIKKMVVPLDGSELAESVLPHVESLAQQLDAASVEIVLVAVCEATMPPSLYPTGPPDLEADLARCRESNERYFSAVEQPLRTAGLTVRSETLLGRAADEIVDYAKTTEADLIVMATHGRSGISRWVYGSVAEKVLLGASSPILLVRARQR